MIMDWEEPRVSLRGNGRFLLRKFKFPPEGNRVSPEKHMYCGVIHDGTQTGTVSLSPRSSNRRDTYCYGHNTYIELA